MEIGNLPKREFRVMIAKMIQELGKRIKHKARSYNKFLTNN